MEAVPDTAVWIGIGLWPVICRLGLDGVWVSFGETSSIYERRWKELHFGKVDETYQLVPHVVLEVWAGKGIFESRDCPGLAQT